MTKDLYSQQDIKKTREIFKQEQGNLCKITGLLLVRPVLDHRHDNEQLCRGVLESTVNVFLGVIERAHIRYIKHSCDIPLPIILRNVADYLENTESEDRFRHNHWLKKIQTRFNSLPEPLKRSVLNSLGKSGGSNATERKKLFQEVLKGKSKGYSDLLELITKTKENQ